jgi:hypothetical protein
VAKGSHDTLGGWEPKTCCICGGPVVKARDGALRFHMDDVTGEARSWHYGCELEHGWPLTEGGGKG